jgi:2-succinyl-6-hydroxy-2,4-cyclohexadiene-1-carboxylate synthase
VRVAAQARVAREREDERRAARAGGGARCAHAAARELVDERAQQDICVDGARHTIGGVRETLVLLHGFGATHRAWDGVLEHVDAERYRALALDLPGHGASAALEAPPTFAACVAHVLGAAPGRFTLCGYSMGGRVALHVALAAHARAQRLVLIACDPGIEDERERAARRVADERVARELEQDGIEAFSARWNVQPLFASDPPRVRALARKDQLRNDPHALAAALRGLGAGTMEPLWGRLPELTMPVTFIAGERDAKFTAIGRRVSDAVSDCRLVVLRGGGHRLPLEDPAGTARAIEADHA